MGADAFPDDATEHRDLDGDGLGDVADLDMDGDGSLDEVDVWPEDAQIWSDTDGDGYADQGLHPMSDNCPNIYGKSKIRLKGCSDIDGDFLPDEYDDDADGDGIRNEMERSASSGTVLYDPYNPLPPRHRIQTKTPFQMFSTQITITMDGLITSKLTEAQTSTTMKKHRSRCILAPTPAYSMRAGLDRDPSVLNTILITPKFQFP